MTCGPHQELAAPLGAQLQACPVSTCLRRAGAKQRCGGRLHPSMRAAAAAGRQQGQPPTCAECFNLTPAIQNRKKTDEAMRTVDPDGVAGVEEGPVQAVERVLPLQLALHRDRVVPYHLAPRPRHLPHARAQHPAQAPAQAAAGRLDPHAWSVAGCSCMGAAAPPAPHLRKCSRCGIWAGSTAFSMLISLQRLGGGVRQRTHPLQTSRPAAAPAVHAPPTHAPTTAAGRRSPALKPTVRRNGRQRRCCRLGGLARAKEGAAGGGARVPFCDQSA